jgi:hypothetical protein
MAWIITKDRLFDPSEKGSKSRVGTCSHNYKNECAEWKPFRILDDDGEVYYEGLATPETDFEPLDDFGMPDAGCTEIQYKNDKGEWETL